MGDQHWPASYSRLPLPAHRPSGYGKWEQPTWGIWKPGPDDHHTWLLQPSAVHIDSPVWEPDISTSPAFVPVLRSCNGQQLPAQTAGDTSTERAPARTGEGDHSSRGLHLPRDGQY
ncbi:hypothetical protein TNCV_4673801 [Trichonephila clavipes]|nr:hypothetical protein TNCV_4673801 [Trichonephila clavipes]